MIADARVVSTPANQPHPEVRHPERYPWTFKLDDPHLYTDEPFRLGFQSWSSYPPRFRPFPQIVARIRIDPYAINREDPSDILLALDSGEHDLLPLLVNEIGKNRNSRRCAAAGYAGVVYLHQHQ